MHCESDSSDNTGTAQGAVPGQTDHSAGAEHRGNNQGERLGLWEFVCEYGFLLGAIFWFTQPSNEEQLRIAKLTPSRRAVAFPRKVMGTKSNTERQTPTVQRDAEGSTENQPERKEA